MPKQAKYRKHKMLAVTLLIYILLTLAFQGSADCYEQTFYPRRDYKGPVHLVIEIKGSSSKICIPNPLSGLKLECFGKIIWGPNEGTFEASFRIGEMGLDEHYISVEGFEKKEKDEVTLTVFAELKGKDSDCYEIKRIDFREGKSGYQRASAKYSVTEPKWSKISDQVTIPISTVTHQSSSVVKRLDLEFTEVLVGPEKRKFSLIKDEGLINKGLSIMEKIVVNLPLQTKQRIGSLYFGVIDDKNSYGGGNSVVVGAPSLKKYTSDAIAFVIAHEIAHITLDHKGIPEIGKGPIAWFYEMDLSRDQEESADKFAITYMQRAGFNVKGAIEYFKSNIPYEEGIRGALSRIMMQPWPPTHPSDFDRLEHAREALVTRAFKDILNREPTLNEIVIYVNKLKAGMTEAQLRAELQKSDIKPPTTTGCVATVSSDRWKGEYFANKSLSGNPGMVRDDGTGFLPFDWKTDSPSSACGIPSDNFSARWTRTFYFEGGTYRFSVTADDGVRLYVDNSLKIDKWIDQAAATYTVDVPLSAGNHTLRMEYYESGGQAVAKLSWQKVLPPPKWEEIPSSSLLPNFRKVNDKIFSGGQPKSEEAVKWLANRGIKAIVNLESVIEEELKKEKEWAKKYNINYIWYPTPPTALPPVRCPTKNEIETAIIIINNPNNQPVYVHCLRGIDRTGIVIAAYRVKMESWSVEAAINEWKKSGILYLPSWEKCFRDYYTVTQPIEKTTITPLKEPIISKSIPLGPYPSGQKYYLRVFNVDDLSKVKINGREILNVSYYNERELDITGYLMEGKNSIELSLENTGGGWTYGYTLKQGNNLIWNESCGKVGIEGCRNNDQSRGIVARHLINLSITAQPISTSPTTPPTISPKVIIFPSSGPVGTTFTQTGKGFTPNRTATIYGRNPDGSVVRIITVNIDSTGSFTSTWTAQTPGNNLARWAVDDATGKKSNEIVFNVTPAGVSPLKCVEPPKGGATDEWCFSTYGYRYCTDYVKNMAQQKKGVKISGWGHAKDWLKNSTGYAKGKTPEKDSIVVFNYPPLGHVAWIEELRGETFKISEWNYGKMICPECTITENFGEKTERWINKNDPNISGFIYLRQQIPPSTEPVIKSVYLGPYPSGQKYYLRVFNVDDLSKVKINGREILSVGYYNERDLDITGYLMEGKNSIELTLENTGGGWTYGYTLRQGNNVIWNESCGRVGIEGCRNNDQTRGMVARHLINLSLTAKPISTPTPPTTPPQPSLPTVTSISARVDLVDIIPRSVQTGGMVTLRLRFTNTGNVTNTFIAGASLWRPGDYSNPIANFERSVSVSPGQSTEVTWSYQPNLAGNWGYQFAVWKQKPFIPPNLLVKQPSPISFFSVTAPTVQAPAAPAPTPSGPSISSISPTQVQAGQFTLTINGSGFDSGAVDQFYTPSGQYMGSGAQSGGLVSRNSNQIVVRENLTGAPAGTYTVRVKNSDGKMSSPVNISVSAAAAPAPAPQVVSARIDGYSPADPNNPIRVQIGGSTVLSVRFTNTGNTAWRFIAGASVWDSAARIVGDYSSTLSAPLQPGQQTTVSFNHIVRNAGDFWVQFGVWKQTPFTIKENLLVKSPSPAQRLIIGR